MHSISRERDGSGTRMVNGKMRNTRRRERRGVFGGEVGVRDVLVGAGEGGVIGKGALVKRVKL